jgi:hypothetical protein
MKDDPGRQKATGVTVSRRAVLRAAAWSTPVVALATVAPAAAAASIVIPDPIIPTPNPLPIPEPTLPQVTVPPALKTVPPPIPGVPPGPGRPSIVLPDKIPPKIFKPKNNGLTASNESTPQADSAPSAAPPSAPTPKTTQTP